MEHRLGRTLRVFLVILATAGFYRLAVVPIVEPRSRDVAASIEMTPEEAAKIRAQADRRLEAIGDLFPPDAWERQNPIVLESRQMRLLFKEYQSLPDGRVNLVPCTLVVLPDSGRTADGPAGRTTVMRAPQGAVLEFDEPLDLRQGRLARLVGGSLRGQVMIRGTPSAPGAEDDIEIVTRDVELDELEVRTGEAVQFRYGRSNGSGRGLLARLTPRATQAGPSSLGQGPNIGGVDSIRLDRDVRIRLEGMSGGFMPGQPAKKADAARDEPAPPVLVSCRGSLTFNVAASVLTLTDHVDVVRPTPEGGSDQITCDLLAILLGPPQEKGNGPPAAKRSLEPTEIQAKGAPVVVRSTGAQLEARATRLGYEVATRRILLDGTEPVSLVARGSEMEARKIDYTPGPPGAPGSLMAVGPGWLRVSSPGEPPSHARWQQWLRMRPDGDGHVVSISGDADVVVETRGRLSAGEMHLWLDVAPPPPGAPPRDPTAGPDLSGVKPSRMLARGMVEVAADRVVARTDRLELWFREPPAPVRAAPAAQPSPPVAAAVPAPRQAAPAPLCEPEPSGGRITATAALVRGLVTITKEGAELTEMSMEGQVELVEQPTAGAPEGQPVEIRGDQMQLARPAAFDARAVVSGRPATIVGRGLDLEGPLVEFDRGRNRVTVDGAGRLSLPMPADGPGLDGLAMTGAAAPPKPPAADAQRGKLDVTWKGRLDFDGQTARFVEDVVANGGTTVVRSGSLDVVFDAPFQFAGDADAQARRQPGRQPEVARIACGSGVKIESESLDEAGDRSVERLFVRDLVIERASGEVSGTGPGRLTSTRKGQSPQFAPPATPGSTPVTPVAATSPAGKGLSYLGVDFQRGLRGNIHRRSMEFHQRVEAIWGPVSGFDDALDPHAPRGLPEGAVTIACDVLGVGQSPPMPGQPRGTLELGATGNVLVEGESFTARSARLNWSEAKDLLVFAGDGRSDAQLFRQLKAGSQPSTAAAGRILDRRGLNRVEVEDTRFFDFDQLGGGQAPNLPGAGLGTRATAPTPFTPPPVPGT